MTAQTTFLTALDEFQEVGRGAELEPEQLESGTKMYAEIERFQLLIPLVGAFNAGKTSLVNAYLQRQEGPALPTDIVPQTALATEIHPASPVDAEHVDLLGEEGVVLQSVGLEEFGQIEQQTLKTGQLEALYAKAYLHDADLPNADRKILVDMPGLDSGLRTHNAAIQRYLGLGGYFIMVIDADHGTLRQSEISQLREFLGQEVEFTVLVNKIDKKKTDAEAILGHIEDQVRKTFGKPAPVRAVSAKEGDVSALADTLAAIDFHSALRGFWRPKAVRLMDEAIQTLHTRFSALNLSTAESDQLIADLEMKKKAMEDKLRQDERDIPGRYSSQAVDRIVRACRDAVGDAAPNLAENYIHGGQATLDREVNELVRETLNRTGREQWADIWQRIVQRYQAEIDGFNAEYDRLTGSAGGELSPTLGGTLIDAGSNGAQGSGRTGDVNAATKSTLFTSLGMVIPILRPLQPLLMVLDAVVDMVSSLFGGQSREQEQQQQIERERRELPTRIRSSVAPRIASELRPWAEAEYAEIAQGMLAQLRQQVEAAVGRVQAGIKKSRAELDARKQDIEGQRNMLRAASEKLASIKQRLGDQPRTTNT